MATLIAPKDFSPIEDAENIKKACLGWGTDEMAILSVLGHRNSFQRKLIRIAYEEIYQEDLITQLQSELSGEFERAVCLWTSDSADRDAMIGYEALQKATPDYRALVEISCSKSPEDLLAMKRAYRFRYKHSLEEDVASHTTGHIRKLLVGVISAYRYEGPEINEKTANLEAEILHDDIHGDGITYNHDELIRVLTTRSKTQLKATLNRYKDIYGTSFTKDLSGIPVNEYLATLRMGIRCIRDPKKYYAKVLRCAINAEITDETALSRVIVTRAEKDLMDIKQLYLTRNNISLEDAISQHTYGDYKTFLLALLGN
ncbi:annexin D8 [Euphorbia lathyris]|uniref:annexin D8 n=1 Tax=Euphorbia lathyris TaxID=212925 RepID=UPI0033141FC3